MRFTFAIGAANSPRRKQTDAACLNSKNFPETKINQLKNSFSSEKAAPPPQICLLSHLFLCHVFSTVPFSLAENFSRLLFQISAPNPPTSFICPHFFCFFLELVFIGSISCSADVQDFLIGRHLKTGVDKLVLFKSGE